MEQMNWQQTRVESKITTHCYSRGTGHEQKRVVHCYSKGTEWRQKGLCTFTVEALNRVKMTHHCSRGAAWWKEREKARCKERELNTPQGGFNETVERENCGLDIACKRDTADKEKD
jgi:hypothetical protein